MKKVFFLMGFPVGQSFPNPVSYHRSPQKETKQRRSTTAWVPMFTSFTEGLSSLAFRALSLRSEVFRGLRGLSLRFDIVDSRVIYRALCQEGHSSIGLATRSFV